MMQRDLRNVVTIIPPALALASALSFFLLAGSARADAALDAFLQESADPASTLTLERNVAAALARNDRAWFTQTAQGQDRELNRALSAIEGAKAAADAAKVGPCNLAWMTLRSYIARVSRDMRAIGPSAPLIEAAPQDVANTFALQMGRCEVGKGMPRGKRLVGVDAGA